MVMKVKNCIHSYYIIFFKHFIPLDYAVVEVGCDSDSEAGEDNDDEEEQKCIMCSKVFLHAENLRIHIQSHLGAKAQLRSCQRCKK